MIAVQRIKCNVGESMQNITIRKADKNDLESILFIYNQGIEDRIATLEAHVKDLTFMESWFQEHQGRYSMLVVEIEGNIAGWAS